MLKTLGSSNVEASTCAEASNLKVPMLEVCADLESPRANAVETGVLLEDMTAGGAIGLVSGATLDSRMVWNTSCACSNFCTITLLLILLEGTPEVEVTIEGVTLEVDGTPEVDVFVVFEVTPEVDVFDTFDGTSEVGFFDTFDGLAEVGFLDKRDETPEVGVFDTFDETPEVGIFVAFDVTPEVDVLDTFDRALEVGVFDGTPEVGVFECEALEEVLLVVLTGDIAVVSLVGDSNTTLRMLFWWCLADPVLSEDLLVRIDVV